MRYGVQVNTADAASLPDPTTRSNLPRPAPLRKEMLTLVVGEGSTVALPVAPVSGLTTAVFVPVPPTMTKVAGVEPEGHAAVTAFGTIVSAGGGGSAVPNTLLAVGGVSTVRPAASVIANVRFVKHVPLVVIVNPPPLR